MQIMIVTALYLFVCTMNCKMYQTIQIIIYNYAIYKTRFSSREKFDEQNKNFNLPLMPKNSVHN